MMSLISRLRKLDIDLEWIDSRLKINAPHGTMTKELLEEITRNKDVLMTYLKTVQYRQVSVNIPLSDEKPSYELSAAQKRLYVLHQYDRGSTAYNIPAAISLSGELDKQRVEDVFRQLIRRHHSLRTCFVLQQDQPMQQIQQEVDFTISHCKGAQLPIGAIIEDFIQPFDLAVAPLMRATLVEYSDQQHVLLLDMHHIISDGSSQAILIHDFAQLYQQKALPPLALQYKDFSEWQNSAAGNARQLAQKAFWLEQFSGFNEVLQLPADFSRPITKNYEGDSFTIELDHQLTLELKSMAEAEDLTMPMLMFSAFAILLHKLSGQEDIVIGLPSAGRNHPGLEGVIGMFVNTLPIRLQLERRQRITEFLAMVKVTMTAALDNQDFQYEQLVEALQWRREAARNPLFDVMFIYQDISGSELSIPGLDVAPCEPGYSPAKFDLTLEIQEHVEGSQLRFEYATAIFSKSRVDRYAHYFKKLLVQIIAGQAKNLADLELADEKEKAQLLAFNPEERPYFCGKTLIHLFEEQVRAHPDKVAVHFEAAHLTYDELDRRANCLANYLIKKGVTKGTLVPICTERSFNMLIGILAIQKAGAAYVPIDPEYPQERIAFILKDTNARWILCQTKSLEVMSKDFPTVSCIALDCRGIQLTMEGYHPGISLEPEDLAYVIYTSGSTGHPKGVMIEHGAILNTIMAMDEDYPLETSDHYLLKTTYTFDVSVAELFGWFPRGGSLYILPPDRESDPQFIIQTIEDHRITHINFVPSMFSIFVDELKNTERHRIGSLKHIFLAGEALSRSLVDHFNKLGTGVTLKNIYGPTEAAIYCCGYATDQLDSTNNVPIGKPLYNTQLLILDEDQRLQPIGITGELCIAGKGLARGYLHRPELTARSFVEHPLEKGKKIYRTGDLARWLPDGNIEYLGRKDHQIKLRGFRIELGEIEAHLSNHPAIQEAVVMLQKRSGDMLLVAYYTATQEVPPALLKQYLDKKLPHYMIPDQYVHMERWPTTANGKLDRKKLPVPFIRQEHYLAPASREEKALVSLWSEVLQVDPGLIGVTHNFFELGGHSLKATVLVNKINRQFRVELSLKEFFLKQNIQSLADYLITIRQTELVTQHDHNLMEIRI